MIGRILLAAVSLSTVGCFSRTKVIAENVELGTDRVRAQMERPWSSAASALQICIEPAKTYARRPSGSCFVGPDGVEIRPFAVLQSTSGDERTLQLSGMYVDHNLACFSVHRSTAEAYESVELRADRPIMIDRAYWYWYYFH